MVPPNNWVYTLHKKVKDIKYPLCVVYVYVMQDEGIIIP